MKICVSLRDSRDNPVQRVVEQICSLCNHEVVEDVTEAEVAIVGSTHEALALLKDHEHLKVIIATTEERDAVGARALVRSYPERAVHRPVIERGEEQNLVVYLMHDLERG